MPLPYRTVPGAAQVRRLTVEPPQPPPLITSVQLLLGTSAWPTGPKPFSEGNNTRLELLSNQTLKSGVVLLTYKVTGTGRAGA